MTCPHRSPPPFPPRLLPPRGLTFGEASPAEEVSSLIALFEDKISRSDTDNAQLQDFCTHLESLLAGGGSKRDVVGKANLVVVSKKR